MSGAEVMVSSAGGVFSGFSVPDKDDVEPASVADGEFVLDSFMKPLKERTVDGRLWGRIPFYKRGLIDDFC